MDDHIKLLCDIGELNHLFRESMSVEDFMERTVVLVSQHLQTDVCSIYIYDDDEEVLVLEATKGLKAEAVGQVSMKLGEGLTGKALKELRPIVVSGASSDPSYKHFSGIDEELYENFLAVPITRGVVRIGVLVLQRKQKRTFSESDIMACRGVASQLANIIENAKFLMTLHTPKESHKVAKDISGLKFVRGRLAAEGYAHSPAKILDKDRTFELLERTSFDGELGLEDFERAVKITGEQLEELQSKVEEKLSDSASLIFASHLLILKDHEFTGQMRKRIESGVNAAEAIIQVARHYIDIFHSSHNDYMIEKTQDVEDLAVRLVSNLNSGSEELVDYAGHVIITKELFPSDILRLSSEGAAGVVLVSGGVTSHLSILARSLAMPTIIVNNSDLLEVPDGTMVLLDGYVGNLYVEPGEDVVKDIEERYHVHQHFREELPRTKEKTFTRDGKRIRLMANINLLGDVRLANKLNCEGVGLYRTEFPFIIRNNFPSEQEQVATYGKLIEAMGDKPITLRTLDIGGDKVLSYYRNARERNPSMGIRSIRFSLARQDIFRQQIRAMLVGGADADIRIMFPMVSSLEELRRAKAIVFECMDDLGREGAEFNSEPKLGMMVEIPSVVSMVDEFAREADFLSVGTNDLVQFTLAVDRTNENVEGLYQPYHPAVIRMIGAVARGASRARKPLSVCGDMAGMPCYVPLLIGLGVEILSLDPAFLPRVQKTIENVSTREAKKLARRVLKVAEAGEIAEILDVRDRGLGFETTGQV
jgi:phosphotransferase system enzyme I (PtsP)